MLLALLMLTCCLGIATSETPVTYPGPVVADSQYAAPHEPNPSYGPPQYVHPEKNLVPITYNTPEEGFGIEAGYQGFLVPALEAVNTVVGGSTPNPTTTPNPLAAILSASSDLLANTDFSSSLLGSSSLLSKPWFWGIAPKIASSLLKAIGGYLVKFAMTILLGGGFTVAVCTFTPICTLSFLGFGFTQKSLRSSMRSFITQDRLTTLTSYITEAIERYRKMQQQKSYKEKNQYLKKHDHVKKDIGDSQKENDFISTQLGISSSSNTEKPQNVHNVPRKTGNILETPAEQIL